MNDVRSFEIATRVVSGVGCLSGLPAELRRFGTRIAVVADQGVAAAGLLARVLEDVAPGDLAATVLVGPDPDVEVAEDAARKAREAECDVVLAVGGGSALGAAKTVAIRLTNDLGIAELEGVDEAPVRPAPSVAVPTTAGSGGEVSRVLVLHEHGRPAELVVRVLGAEPRVAFLDATMLRTLPRAPMLHAGLDALTHGLESQWARRQSSFTTMLARGAARTLIDLLPSVVDGCSDGANGSGRNDEVLQRVLEASSAANMACGNTGLTLVHALTGAPAIKIPHGQQNGMLLPHVARFNEPRVDEVARGQAAELDGLYRRLGVEASFAEGAVGPGGARAMLAASTGHPFRLNNLRESADAQVVEILRAAGAGSAA